MMTTSYYHMVKMFADMEHLHADKQPSSSGLFLSESDRNTVSPPPRGFFLRHLALGDWTQYI